jgi:MoxR-like ATPase
VSVPHVKLKYLSGTPFPKLSLLLQNNFPYLLPPTKYYQRMKIRPKIEGLLEHLNDGVYEKQEVIGLALLATMAGGKGLFMLGPVGVAKSLVASRLKFIFHDAKCFEYLMTKYSTPDEIFGNISVSKLKNDVYERLIDGFMPTADVVFLDEIWKSSSSIQNAILRFVNEKLFRNGKADIKVAMKAFIAASNEMPEKGQDAIWDRILIRYTDSNIRDRDNFDQMICDDNDLTKDCVPASLKITFQEYDQIVKLIGGVKVPQSILNLIQIIRAMIQAGNELPDNAEKQIYVSDRRWKNIMRLLKTSAFLNDRAEVNLSDCLLMPHCIWNEPEQFVAVAELVDEAIMNHGYFNKNATMLTKAKDELAGYMANAANGQAPNLLDNFNLEVAKAQSLSGLTNFVKTQKKEIEKAMQAEMKTENLFITDPDAYEIIQSCFDNAVIEIEQIEIDIQTLTENA